MNAAYRVTCVSTSVLTHLEVTPVSAHKDISSRETDYVRVMHFLFLLYFDTNSQEALSVFFVLLVWKSLLNLGYFYYYMFNVPNSTVIEILLKLHNTNLPYWATPIKSYDDWFSVEDLLETPVHSRGELLLFSSSPPQSGASFTEGVMNPSRCVIDHSALKPSGCARNSPVVWGTFDDVFMELQGKSWIQAWVRLHQGLP